VREGAQAGSRASAPRVRGVAALYDIHGNLPALDAVLDDLARERVDLIVVGGDVASGPLPKETIARLHGLGTRARFVRGNADRELVEAFDARSSDDAAGRGDAALEAWAADQLDERDRAFLGDFEETVTVDVLGLGRVLFCHGSPRRDDEIVTSVTSEQRLAGIVADVDAPVVVCGHTHRQFVHELPGITVVNAGSVGLPYEGDAAAFWLLLSSRIALRRSGYDVQDALARFRAAGFPDEPMLEESLVTPADPTAIAEFFESQAAASTP
jgi:putative phosphoesterase